MDSMTLKREVAAVLQDVPNHTLPLFKFREMFEKRYRRSVSTSDLYRMRDVVSISESSNSALGGRKISLLEEWSNEGDDGLNVFCRSHPPSMHGGFGTTRLGWAEKETDVSLPNVEIDFRTLSARLGTVLVAHQGAFPLFSFLDCYGSQYGGMKRLDDGGGVPLEHLIASVHGVEINYAENGMKRVQWRNKGEFESGFPGTSVPVTFDPLSLPLAQLSRELVDLLKTMPRCSIQFAKLIPAYHHHFGKQCRVADYGHITLSSLLQTLPNTIQVLGEGANRVITLAHRAQMKRFASDVFRVLKTQPGVKKQIRVADFPQIFAVTFPTRSFCPEDYGLCFFSDLVTELVENFSLVTLLHNDLGEDLLAIPKREQTLHEQQKMRIFAAEVVELLRHSIRCEMQFSKFIPSYHHHFGKQCRVSDYGFTKLAELFDALTDTVTCEFTNNNTEGSVEEKILRLTPNEQVKVVGGQIREAVEKQLEIGLVTRVGDLEEIFLAQHGFALRVDLCGATDLRDLLHRLLFPWVKVEGDIIRILAEEEKRMRMTGEELIATYASNGVILDEIQKELAQMGITETSVTELDEKFKRLRVFGEEMRTLLEEAGGYLGIQNIEAAYNQKYNRPLIPVSFGCNTLMTLLQSIPDVATLRGKFRSRRILVLNRMSTSENRSHGGGGGPYRSKFFGSETRHQDGHKGGWNTQGHNSSAQTQPQKIPPPLFSPLVPSPVFRPRDTNIFNFEQPTSLSSPVYDIWVGDGPQGSPPPSSPSFVWAYHPFCYPPPPPPQGSPNMFIPSYPYALWNSSQTTQPPLMSPPTFELEHQPPAPVQ